MKVLYKKGEDRASLILSDITYSDDGFIKTAEVINGGWILRRQDDFYNACVGERVVTSNIFTINDYELRDNND
jgi:hypothetical protein